MTDLDRNYEFMLGEKPAAEAAGVRGRLALKVEFGTELHHTKTSRARVGSARIRSKGAVFRDG
jgi:hypothetical protein